MCSGSSVPWELVYFILSFATVALCGFPVKAMEKSILPFKHPHAVFWLREEFAEVIQKDLGNVGLGLRFFCSVSQQSEMIYKWSDGRGGWWGCLAYFFADVGSAKPSQVAAIFLGACGRGKPWQMRSTRQMGTCHGDYLAGGNEISLRIHKRWREAKQTTGKRRERAGKA